MPRIKRFSKGWKGFLGKSPQDLRQDVEAERPSDFATPSTSFQVGNEPLSGRSFSSSSKFEADFEKYERFDSTEEYDIVDVNKISEAIGAVACCKACGGEISMSVVRRKHSQRATSQVQIDF
uniref:Uncharacterized protein n=2 Tax=Lygus hesperus TaxID=30085 RepID=A0A0A9W0A7_LYGHE